MRITRHGDFNVDSAAGGLATWADLKANAARIGVTLTDAGVHDAPALGVDATGKLMFTPNPAAAWTTTSWKAASARRPATATG